ncbi:MAG: GPW/gp25 family protein [Bacteroidales bacterium]|nr:GPW/gp25 family protein [Bacteroidales bacterium]
MPKFQKYGIKFPFNIISRERTLLDANKSKAEMVKSDLMHLIFTPRGQRLRQPTFGSSLIQFIFNPNDNESWGDVEAEVKDMVATWIPDCTVNELSAYETEDGRGLIVAITYSVTESDGTVSTYQLATPI